MSNTMSYTIDFVPFTTLLDKDSRNDMFRFAKWIDEQNGDQFATRNILQTASCLNNPMLRMMTKSICECVWYVVLKQNGKVVSVALYQKSMEITTITTAKDERNKGHATYLMAYLRELFEKHGVKVVCPAEKRILPVLAKAGWTTADTVLNPDGTIDTMPDYVKAEYIRTTKSKPIRPINERCVGEVMAFMDFLPSLNAPVPTV